MVRQVGTGRLSVVKHRTGLAVWASTVSVG